MIIFTPVIVKLVQGCYMFFSRIASSTALCVTLLFSVNNSAQEVLLPCDEITEEVLAETPENAVKLVTEFQAAEPISRFSLKYPEAAAKKGAEGWVQMSYVIDKEGNVQDPLVEDFGGHRAFKKEALRGLKRWKFSPAMKDGKPTEQCHSSVRFDFTLNIKPGATRTFRKQYIDAVALIEAKEYAKVEKILKYLHNRDNNRYENAWLWSLDARVGGEKQDHKRQLASIRRTISSAKVHDEKYKTFDDEYSAYLHRQKFLLELRFAKYADALHTLEEIETLPNAQEVVEKLSDNIALLHELMQSEENIFVPGTIPKDETFHHALVRNNFGFANINGELSTVEVRCDTKRMKYTIANDHVWQIPESWGSCNIIVSGDKGTTFYIAEVNEA